MINNFRQLEEQRPFDDRRDLAELVPPLEVPADKRRLDLFEASEVDIVRPTAGGAAFLLFDFSTL